MTYNILVLAVAAVLLCSWWLWNSQNVSVRLLGRLAPFSMIALCAFIYVRINPTVGQWLQQTVLENGVSMMLSLFAVATTIALAIIRRYPDPGQSDNNCPDTDKHPTFNRSYRLTAALWATLVIAAIFGIHALTGSLLKTGASLLLGAAYLFVMIKGLVYLADRDYFFTIVEEGDVKYVVSRAGGALWAVMQFRDRAIQGGRIVYHPDSVFSPLLDALGLKGLKFIGVPGLHQLKKHRETVRRVRQQSSVGDDGCPRDKRTVEVLEGERTELTVRDEVYDISISKAEDLKLVPLDITGTVRARIVNPYLALFKAVDWYEIMISTIEPAIRKMVALSTWEDFQGMTNREIVFELRNLNRREFECMHGEKPEDEQERLKRNMVTHAQRIWMHEENERRAARNEKRFRETGSHDADEPMLDVFDLLPTMVDELRETYGIEIIGVHLETINPADITGDALREQAIAPFLAERQRVATVTAAQGERDATVHRADGERQALELRGQGERKRIEEIHAAGEEAFAVFRQDTLREAAQGQGNIVVWEGLQKVLGRIADGNDNRQQQQNRRPRQDGDDGNE